MSREPDQIGFEIPVPPDVQRDWSGGLRAIVSDHAVRRYAERVWGCVYPDAMPDPAAVADLVRKGWPVKALRERLAYRGGVALRFNAPRFPLVAGCCGVLRDGVVVTVKPPRGSKP
jgi:hypothetical protein